MESRVRQFVISYFMKIPYIISFLSICVWIFPPFKQYKTDYFYFFLVLSIISPVTHALFFLFRISSLISAVTFTFIVISTLMSYRKQRYFFIILSILWFVFALSFSIHRNILIITFIGEHIFIVIILINSLMKYLEKTKAVNLFLILLITYELINILKFTASLLSIEQGTISFVLATFIQIFFGIAFLFISFKTKDFPIYVKD